jgi:polar amino acid transport system ATP-binding protein
MTTSNADRGTADPGPLAPAPLIRVEGAVKRFGMNVVLDHVDLDIAPREVVAIIGPSGSGKTTLLRSLNCLELLDEGQLSVNGERISAYDKKGKAAQPRPAVLREVRRKVGMVFQSFNLFPHMTALRNIATPLERTQGFDRQAAELKALSLLERIGLGEKSHSYPSQLSGGEQQRVAIARALVLEPQVLLCDEVTSALDPEMVGEVLAVLKQLAGSGMTMAIVTHEMQFAVDVADRLIVMDLGKVIESGRPAEVFGAPREPRTVQFLKRVLDRGGLFLGEGHVVKYSTADATGPQVLETQLETQVEQ